MSTNGLIGFIYENKFRGAYNHSSSYPSALGQWIVNFCNSVEDWEKFKSNYRKVKWVSGSRKPTKKQIEQYYNYADLSVSNRTVEDMYCLLSGLHGVKGLEAIRDGETELMIDSSSFIKDSLFCEYAYILNLDDMTLQFYEGFQQKAQAGNRFGVREVEGYYPCKWLGECNIQNIPQEWRSIFYPEEGED